MAGRTFSREFKLELVKQVVSGQKRPAQVCREHKLAESLLGKWRKEYAARGEAAFTAVVNDELTQEALLAKIAQMEQFIGQQALEIAVLKKALKDVR